jgi:hypothetical protein
MPPPDSLPMPNKLPKLRRSFFSKRQNPPKTPRNASNATTNGFS